MAKTKSSKRLTKLSKKRLSKIRKSHKKNRIIKGGANTKRVNVKIGVDVNAPVVEILFNNFEDLKNKVIKKFNENNMNIDNVRIINFHTIITNYNLDVEYQNVKVGNGNFVAIPVVKGLNVGEL